MLHIKDGYNEYFYDKWLCWMELFEYDFLKNLINICDITEFHEIEKECLLYKKIYIDQNMRLHTKINLFLINLDYEYDLSWMNMLVFDTKILELEEKTTNNLNLIKSEPDLFSSAMVTKEICSYSIIKSRDKTFAYFFMPENEL